MCRTRTNLSFCPFRPWNLRVLATMPFFTRMQHSYQVPRSTLLLMWMQRDRNLWRVPLSRFKHLSVLTYNRMCLERVEMSNWPLEWVIMWMLSWCWIVQPKNAQLKQRHLWVWVQLFWHLPNLFRVGSSSVRVLVNSRVQRWRGPLYVRPD